MMEEAKTEDYGRRADRCLWEWRVDVDDCENTLEK